MFDDGDNEYHGCGGDDRPSSLGSGSKDEAGLTGEPLESEKRENLHGISTYGPKVLGRILYGG